jgi:hypothetical protein
MKIRPPVLIALVLMTGLAGCGDNDQQQTVTTRPSPSSGGASAQPTKTVAWFIEHRAELRTILKACRDNPGELGKAPDCVNANEARNQITVQEMKDALK